MAIENLCVAIAVQSPAAGAQLLRPKRQRIGLVDDFFRNPVSDRPQADENIFCRISSRVGSAGATKDRRFLANGARVPLEGNCRVSWPPDKEGRVSGGRGGGDSVRDGTVITPPLPDILMPATVLG